MNLLRRSILRSGLALVFALVLPVASAHCVTMALASESSAPGDAGAMRADHACCVSGAATGERSEPSPPFESGCACIGLPTATAPTSWSLEVPVAVASLFRLAEALLPPAHPSLPRAPRSSEPPPLACDPGGPSLRGPPARG